MRDTHVDLATVFKKHRQSFNYVRHFFGRFACSQHRKHLDKTAE